MAIRRAELDTPVYPAAPALEGDEETLTPAERAAKQKKKAAAAKKKKAQQKKAAAARARQLAAARQRANSAAAIDPLQMLSLVKNGEMNVMVPLAPAKMALGPVSMSIKPNTSLYIHANVKNGQLDFNTLKVKFLPELDGPGSINIAGAKMKGGKLTLDISSFPDVSIGASLPKSLAEFAKGLQAMTTSKKVDLRLLGFKISMAKPQGNTLGDPSALTNNLLNGARNAPPVAFNVKNVEFGTQKVSLGAGNSVQMGPGSKLNLVGSLNDFRLTGTANVRSVNLNTPGVQLEGGSGSATFDVQMSRQANGRAQLATRISNLNLSTRYAATRRPNGDYIALANGALKNGNIDLLESFELNGLKASKFRHQLQRLSIDRFEGALAAARVTLPDAKGGAQVEVGPSRMAGNIHIEPGRIRLMGSLDAQVSVKDLQRGVGPGFVDLERLDLRARGDIAFDSATGQMDLKDGHFALSGKVNAIDGKTTLPQGGGVATGKIGPGTSFSGAVNNLRIDEQGLSFDGAEGRLELRGVNITSPQFQVTQESVEPIAGKLGHIKIERAKLMEAMAGLQKLTGGKLKLPGMPQLGTGAPADGSPRIGDRTTPPANTAGSGPKPNHTPVSSNTPANRTAPRVTPSREARPGEASPRIDDRTDKPANVRAALSQHTMLKLGKRGSEVKELQKRLFDFGVKPGPIDGVFGVRTRAAVFAFQRQKKLKADGVVGQQTWAELLGYHGVPPGNAWLKK